MGTVFRATDRLTGRVVALKQVHQIGPEVTLRPGDTDARFDNAPSRLGTTTGDRLALAREFRLLASLRHPHIISVLDYGFDSRLRPYYTMELLEHPAALLEATQDQPLERQLELLVQTLQALAYLHRRGVIHRDVKPSNVMVENHRVRLVDFGISELRENIESGVSGSVPYMAPEVLDGRSASEASDLYAVGVMAYEMLAGRHPFESDSAAVMMVKTMRESPELTTRDFDARLIPVIERLLAKNPERRYHDAEEVVRDLASPIDHEVSGESAAIRDSFLQSARLMGRDQELRELTDLLKATLEGRGGTVLLGGESGVGKSRLLEELRALALVDGALVLPGQAVQQGGRPYEVWHQVLRWLALLLNPDKNNASVLKPQVPDLAELLGREVPDPPELDPQATQSRFLVAVEHLFQRLEAPTVVLLEDLHWAESASLNLLAQLQQVASHLPLLLVGTFRDDERPALPQSLPGSTFLKLERLDRASIARLSAAMLGNVGRDDAVLDLLQRESEGNAFFLVEVARALATEAGRLDRIDAGRLPQRLSTGKIEHLINRRLRALPKTSRELLVLAAATGRAVDTRLLEALAPNFDLSSWLKACDEAAILEVAAGEWRFAHDRLREMLLHDLPADQLRATHRRVAQAIEQIYAKDPRQVAALAHHWAEAADVGDLEATEQAARYLALAGRQTMANCANHEAAELLTRGLKLHGMLPPTAERQRQEIRLHVDLGATYLMSRGFTTSEVGQAFSRARALSEQTGDTDLLLPALLGLWRFHIVRGELVITRQLAQEMLHHAEARDMPSHRVLGHYTLGATLLFQGEPAPAVEHLQKCSSLYGQLQDTSHREIAAAFFFLGQDPGVAALEYAAWAWWCLGYPDRAKDLAQQGVVLANRIAHPFSQAFARTLITWLGQLRGDDVATEKAATAAIGLCQSFPFFLAVSTLFQGWARARQGQPEEGLAQIRQVLDELRTTGSELFRPYFLTLLAEAHGLAGRPGEGLDLLEEALENAELHGGAWWEPEIHRLRGELLLAVKPTLPADSELVQTTLDEVESAFLKALHRARWRQERALELRAALSLTRLWEKDLERSGKIRSVLKRLYESFTEGLETPDLLEARRLLADRPQPPPPDQG